MKKCRICKKTLRADINLDNWFKTPTNVYYHTECYIERELKKNIPKEIIEDVISTSREVLEVEQNNKIKAYKEKNIKDGLDDLVIWIQSNYSISYLPSYFYIKMASIANGTFKGIKEPIPYHDILDMLQRKKKQFDIKFASKKFNTHLNRFNYDLAVVLAQYDGYKNWKIVQENRKQEMLQDTEFQKRVLETKQVANMTRNNKENNSIEDILDDIF